MNKKINAHLIDIDCNAFALLAQFKKQAKKEGWTKEEIDQVLADAKSKDYNHLVYTIFHHCKISDD